MKQRWRTDLNWLCGVRVRRWADHLSRERLDPAYAHRLAQISALALYNSARARLRPSPVPDIRVVRPLFVLGHWRSGTTWLFHLLASDPARVAPTAFEVTNPTSFDRSTGLSSRLFAGLLPDTRVQDDVPLGFDLPEEDEYAIGLLAGTSPYLGRSFPARMAHYERFLTLHHCTDAERFAFRDAILGFARRLTAHHGRPLVLKSPAHTGRIRFLLRWFPDARFVHIHRDPYAVFASTRHLWDTVDWHWTLQRRAEDVDDIILRQYGELHRAWFADVEQIPRAHRVELAYEDLVADPMGQLARIYRALDLPGFASARPHMQALVEARADHRSTPHRLSEADRARVREVAGPCFDAWGYPR